MPGFLSFTTVKPLANVVQDNSRRDVRCDGYQKRCEHCFHLLSKTRRFIGNDRILTENFFYGKMIGD